MSPQAAPPVRVAVLISGAGSNMAALIDAGQAPDSGYEVVLVLSNIEGAGGLAIAAAKGVATATVAHKPFGKDREAHERAVDAALLSRLLPRISAEFGLSPAQIDALDPTQRERVQKAVALVGSVLIGKLITRELVMRASQTVGLRLTTRQAAKYVPLAGQAVAATIGYATLRYLGEQHLRDCVRVVQQAQLQLPAPPKR